MRRNKDGKPLEADLTAQLGHPNLVSTLDAASAFREPVAKLAWDMEEERQDSDRAPPGQSNADPVEDTWLLLEYCDQGSLMVSRGATCHDLITHLRCCDDPACS